jgi:hypothetical protein
LFLLSHKEMSIMKEYKTDEILSDGEQIPTIPSLQDLSAGTTRFIDIHIYDQLPEQEEPSSIEGTLQDESPEPSQHPPSSSQDTQEYAERHSPRWPWPLVLGALCILIASAIFVVCILPLLTITATVTIVPVTKQVSATSVIPVVPGQANGAQGHLSGRMLSSVSMSQTRTVPTTGKGHQDATSAHGTVTFYNAAPYTQTVTAGTLLTGTDSVEIVTDQDAIIPTVVYPTLGQATVTAHAVIGGPAGNINAGDIYGPCCRLNVSAVNAAFTGGEPARDYPMVTPQDIDPIASNLKASLDQGMQAALQMQVHADETLITPFPCQQRVTPDHQPGDEAAQVTITVSQTCTSMAYSTQAYRTLLEQIASQAAKTQLGDGYHLTGEIQSGITQMTSKGDSTLELQVKITGTWTYRFPQHQQEHIKALLAGKNKAQATALLLHIPGVQSASITIKNNAMTLPTDSADIHLVFLMMGY